jgi:pyrroloquinoline quinone (PQQ) biosynthesis protein C
MAKSAFRLALEEAIEQRHSAVHPWSEAWTSGKLDRRLLGEWVKQHFHYVSHFSEWLGAVYAACPHWDVQHFLLENITEEEGFVGSGDFAPVRHSELLLDFAQTCGMKRDEILNAQIKGELLPETLGLQSWCAVQAQKPFVEALSGLLIGAEIADALHRHGLIGSGPLRSVRLIGAGALGQLYKAALSAQGLDVTTVDAEQASRLGLAKAALALWGARVKT